MNDRVLSDDICSIHVSAFENHPEAMFALDSKGYFRECNKQTCTLLGYPPQDILGRKFADCAPKQQRTLVIKVFQKAMDLKQTQQFEMVCPRHDGRETHIQTTFVPVTIEERDWVMGYGKDITDRVQVERELRQSREYFTRAQDAAQLGICLLDLETRIVEFDKIARVIFGFPSRYVTLREFQDRIFPDDRERIISAIQGAMKEPKLVHGAEYRMVHRDGSVRYVQVHRTTYSTTSNRPVLLGVVQDVTSRKQAEEMLLNSEKLALVGELAAGMAHEIRNPLTVAKGLTELVQSNEVKSDEQHNYFQLIMESLEQMELLTSEMLILSKPQAKTRSTKNIVDIMKGVIRLFDAEAFIHGAEISFECHSQWIPVRCNEHQMKQVFINIVKNAFEAKASNVNVSVASSNDKVRVSIRDNGYGIDPERMKHLGQPFYTTKETGTGLGLMITKEIIHDHDGKLELTSEKGKGTSVVIVLPISDNAF